MIRIDAIWLATEPMDMRAGTETALARVCATSSPELAIDIPVRPATKS